MALYRLHRKEWEQSVRSATDAWRAKEAQAGDQSPFRPEKKQRGNGDFKAGARESFPGGGRKGISSGLGAVVRRNGVRVDAPTGGDTVASSQWWAETAG